MSQDSQEYAFWLRAKQKSGKKSLFVWFTAKNDARAKRDLENMIEDAELDVADFFKAVRTNLPVVDALPGESVFDETFCDSYELCDDGLTWQLIASEKVTPAPKDPPLSVFATNLPVDMKIAGAWLFGCDNIQLNPDQIIQITTLINDDNQFYVQNVLDALVNLELLRTCPSERVNTLVNTIKSVWPPLGEVPIAEHIEQFANELLSVPADSQYEIVEYWQGMIAASFAEPVTEEFQETETQLKVTEPSAPAPRPFHQTFKTLDLEIACALFPGDFDIHAVPGEIKRNAERKIEKDENDWKRWSMCLRFVPKILNYDRATVFGMVANVPSEELHNFPGELRAYVDSYLGQFGEFEPGTEHGQIESAVNITETVPVKESEPPLSSARSIILNSRIAKLVDDEQLPEQEPADVIGDAVSAVLGGHKPELISVERLADAKVEIPYLWISVREVILNEILKVPAALEVSTEVISIMTAEILTHWKLFEEMGSEFVAEWIPLHFERQHTVEATQTLPEEAPIEIEKLGKGVFSLEIFEAPAPASNDEAVVETVEPEVSAAAPHFEPGRYTDISNEVYHAANGLSSTQLKDARVSMMYFNGRHVSKTIQRQSSEAMTFGTLVHGLALEPEKIDNDFSIEPIMPEGAFTSTDSMKKFIEAHNATLPQLLSAEDMKTLIEAYNCTLPQTLKSDASAETVGAYYMELPAEFQKIGADEKPTAKAMKACAKEYDATLPQSLKVSGSRMDLLEQLCISHPELAAEELAKPQPVSVSGDKATLAGYVRQINPAAVFADEIFAEWQKNPDSKVMVTQRQMASAKVIQAALLAHPAASQLLRHPSRSVESSYFGIDEETGLEIRVRPDLEIDVTGSRVGFDLKTISMGNIKKDALRARLHREIIDRDYHLSAALYSDVAEFDQFFWIFVNKEEGHNWVVIVEASPDLLLLGRLEYKNALRDLQEAFETDVWPAPIVTDYTDELSDFDQRRLEALRVA